MIENKKPELEEDKGEPTEQENSKFLRTGTIIIGSIIVLMIFCLVMIFVLEK